jgi:exonuclease III
MSATTDEEAPPLHLVSWNVAGWDATLKYVKEHYKTLDAFLGRHQADILALQEVKLTKAKVTADPAAAHALPFDGWESFWAFPATEGGSKSSAAKRMHTRSKHARGPDGVPCMPAAREPKCAAQADSTA